MTDATIVRAVVRYLGAIAFVLSLGCLANFGLILYASKGRETIDVSVVALYGSLTTLAGGALGALGTLLASTRSTGGPPQDVVVQNQADDPVAVEEVAP